MQALTKKFRTTDIKSLYDALAHHSLQSKFDIHANKNLTIWESLVGHVSSITLITTNVLRTLLVTELL